MGTIARILDMKDQIDHECYFCGSKRNVKYLLTDAISISGEMIEKEVPCCIRCIPYHAYGDDPSITFTTSLVK